MPSTTPPDLSSLPAVERYPSHPVAPRPWSIKRQKAMSLHSKVGTSSGKSRQRGKELASIRWRPVTSLQNLIACLTFISRATTSHECSRPRKYTWLAIIRTGSISGDQVIKKSSDLLRKIYENLTTLQTRQLRIACQLKRWMAYCMMTSMILIRMKLMLYIHRY